MMCDSVVLSASRTGACVEKDSVGLLVWSLHCTWPDRKLCIWFKERDCQCLVSNQC